MTSTVLTQRYEDALCYANVAHGAQLRKGTSIPYLSHLLAVSAIVLEHGGNEDEAIAALLHDAAEDQGGEPRLNNIRARFGEDVAAIVAGCSDTFKTPKPAWRVRKEDYLSHLRDASRSVCLVSAADKLHNARATLSDYQTLKDELWSRFNSTKEDNLWYYEQLVAAFSHAGHHLNLVRDLAAVVTQLRQACEETE
jgi:(p)ppGpp synthase/HD superfamily hydrolase